MSWFRKSWAVCRQNFRRWAADYRVWVVAMAAAIFVHYFTRGVYNFSVMANLPVSPWYFPFLYNHGLVKLFFFLPLVLLFCNAPFIDDIQPYVLVRSGRRCWGVGQVLYVVLATAISFLFLILCTFLFMAPRLTFTTEWGKVIGTLASTNAAFSMDQPSYVSHHVYFYFEPLIAMWYSFLLSWLAGCVLGLLIYVVNLATDVRSLGVLAGCVLLFWDTCAAGMANFTPELVKFSPLSWSNLNLIDIGGQTSYPSITYVMVGYILLIGGLCVAAVLLSRKKTVTVLPPV